MNLIISGDSWPYGSELLPGEKTYGDLLAEWFDTDTYVNTSEESSSITHLILQLKTAVKQLDLTQSTVALFFLTNYDRDVIWSQHRPINTGCLDSTPPPYATPTVIHLNASDAVHQDWFCEFYTKELGEFRTNTSLLTLQTLCRYYNITDYYVWGWNSVELWPEVNRSRFYSANTTSADILSGHADTGFDELQQNKLFKPNLGHPNALGHHYLATEFYHWIKRDQEST